MTDTQNNSIAPAGEPAKLATSSAPWERYRFRATFLQNGFSGQFIVQGRSASDESALETAHILADAVSCCGGSEIEIQIEGLMSREIGCVSDKVENQLSELERQHELGAGFDLNSSQ